MLYDIMAWLIALAISAVAIIIIFWAIIELIDFAKWIFFGGKGPFSK